MNAVIYARYSSHNQREESIEGQIRECKAFADNNDMRIIGEYIDRAISGRTDERADFQRMIRDSEKGRFQAVIVYAIDRFARSRYDSAIYKAKLKKNGVRVYYAKQSIPDTPEGIILESVMEGYAEYYSENLSVHIKRGMKENALECKVTGGTTPLGYRIGADHRYEIDPAGAKIVLTIFEMYADGKNVQSITDYLNDLGVRTARGAKFNKNSLRVILRNQKYIGVYSYKDIVVPDGVPPIVPKDLFERVQRKGDEHTAARARRKLDVDYLLTGKVFCGVCSSPMIGESGTAKSGNLYHYYKCVHRKRHRGNPCSKQVERKDWLEEAVVRETVRVVLQPDMIENIATRGAKLYQAELEDSTILNALKSKLEGIEGALKNLLRAIEQGIILPTTKDRMTELEAEKADILNQIQREEYKRPVLEKDRIAHWLCSFIGGDIRSEEYRRRVIDTFVNRVNVYDTGDGKKRRLTLIYNISGQNTSTVECSDKEFDAPPNRAYPNPITIVVSKGVFGFSTIVRVPD